MLLIFFSIYVWLVKIHLIIYDGRKVNLNAEIKMWSYSIGIRTTRNRMSPTVLTSHSFEMDFV